ncbi:MAG: dephospho-CoA kinase [SAR324 cluster bacterium]|nr:dephospho-CoA kinase [SAR324 cluster bacterium]
MKYIGLTGSIGVGKSTTSKILKKLGATLIDADKLAKQATQPSSLVWPKLIKHFAHCLIDNKKINRQKLAQEVFTNPDQLKLLNHILHPAVNDLLIERLTNVYVTDKTATIIYDAALLIENDADKFCQKVILIKTNLPTVTKRLINSRNTSEEYVKSIFNNQLPTSLKIKKAHFIINNNGDLSKLETQINLIWQKINKLPSVNFKNLVDRLSSRYT